jgi:hypothetical protein
MFQDRRILSQRLMSLWLKPLCHLSMIRYWFSPIAIFLSYKYKNSNNYGQNNKFFYFRKLKLFVTFFIRPIIEKMLFCADRITKSSVLQKGEFFFFPQF